MAATRDRAIHAAIEVLGTEGVRALSHARVDARGGLPPGSTSNWFRTRRALLVGVIDVMAESERADFGSVEPPAGPEALIEGLCAMIELETAQPAVNARARYALFLELASERELTAPLRRQRLEFERWTEQLVSAAGIPDIAPAARALMALSDGLILHRLTVDPELAVRPVIDRTVRSLTAEP